MMSDTVTQIVEYLLAAWDRPFRLTTVGQAVAALGLPAEPVLRRRVADHLAAQPELHPTLARWGYRALALDATERRVARALRRDTTPEPTAAALATSLGLSIERVDAAVASLRHVGLVHGSDAAADVRHADGPPIRLVEDAERLAGPLGFNCHTLTLGTGEVFDVPCARDVLLFAATRRFGPYLRLDTACAVCAAPIAATFADANLTAVEPPGVWYARGGT